jgi:hypothetical protein
MTVAELFAAARDPELPPDLAPLLRALWLDARGDWAGAHRIAQDDASRGAWAHAYLHRKEGDAAHAAYWYRQAKRPEADGAFDEEWRMLASELMSRSIPAA